MMYTYLGASGMRVSRLCLGTVNFGARTDEKEAHAIMDAALDHGINFFDTANHYPDFVNCGRSEEFIGRWFAQGGGRRERVVMASKVYQPMRDPLDGPNDMGGFSKYKVMRHIEGTLKRLRTDHIELYQMHHVDRRAVWEEIWETFETLGAQGKIVYTGSSNFPAWKLAQAQATARARGFIGLVSEQHRYHLLCRLPELEVLPAARELGIGILVYWILAGGLLTGKALSPEAGPRASAQTDYVQANRAAFEAFHTLCEEIGHAPANVAVAWGLANPAVSSVVIGPRTKKQLDGLVKAVEINLSEETTRRLDEIFPGPGGPAPEAYAW